MKHLRFILFCLLALLLVAHGPRPAQACPS
jgi:hypothetical protein